MSASPRMIILGDWGTSNFRLRLYEENRGNWTERDRRMVPGVKFTKDSHSSFFDVSADWIESFGVVGAYLCGMVGSNIGWRDVPHLECPVRLNDVAVRTTEFVANGLAVNIVPGLRCKNFIGAPDVMRGEETQLIGQFTSSEASTNQSLSCLPGTHTKWVVCGDQRVEAFQTSPTGELFEIMTKHSTLTASRDESNFDTAAFHDGLNFSRRHFGVGILHQLFSVRSKGLLGASDTGQDRSYLSGILIGSEVQGIINSLDSEVEQRGVSLISSGLLAESYGDALTYWGIRFSLTDGEDAAFAGLKYVAINNTHQDG